MRSFGQMALPGSSRNGTTYTMILRTLFESRFTERWIERNSRAKAHTVKRHNDEPDWVVFVQAVLGVAWALLWIALMAVALSVAYLVFTRRK
jgi:hypothetical protein